MGTIAAKTDADWEELVKLSHNKPVLIDCWAPWCGPCRALSPILEELNSKYKDKIEIVKVNVDENNQIPTQLGVRGIPAMFLLMEGEIASNKVGLQSLQNLIMWIENRI